jgi:hypothetical protein
MRGQTFQMHRLNETLYLKTSAFEFIIIRHLQDSSTFEFILNLRNSSPTSSNLVSDIYITFITISLQD